MSTPAAIPIDALAAPAEDEEVLVWPGDVALASLAERNHAELTAAEAALLDRPLRDWRRIARGERPVIMAGHQPEFIHAGVWAKHPAVCQVAERLGGVGRFLLVDSDVPNHFVLTWPTEEYGRLRRAWAAPPGSAVGVAFEQFPAVPDDAWRSFFAAIPQDAATALPGFVDAFVKVRSSTGGRPADYVSRWGAGIGAVESSLVAGGIEYVSVAGIFTRRVAPSEAAMAFVADLILSAERFAGAYNDALQSYRRRRGIRGSQHPIPDLHLHAEGVELPFWVVAEGRPRRRLFVAQARDDRVQLFAAGEGGVTSSLALRAGSDERPIATFGVKELRNDPASVLRSMGETVGIRPRALALTLYARLMACDLFIHGIGGAKYDQITDEIIRAYFGIAPPAFACVSATLRLPLEMYDVSATDAREARHRLRDVRHNPQRYLDGSPNGRVSELLEARAAAVRESERLRTSAPRDRIARRRAFERIRQANFALLDAVPGVVTEAREAAALVDSRLAHNATAGSREWFFALQPVARLRMLAERVVHCVTHAG